jgi:hypothetical protein
MFFVTVPKNGSPDTILPRRSEVDTQSIQWAPLTEPGFNMAIPELPSIPLYKSHTAVNLWGLYDVG